jgi:hypothetical protein
MNDAGLRRRLLWHGYLNFLIGLLLGIPVASGWHSRAWLTIHVPQMTAGLALVILGLVWHDLRLAFAAQRRLFRLSLVSTYVGLVAGVFNGIVDFPGPVSQPGVNPVAWTVAVTGPLTAVSVVALFWSVGLTLRGLAGPPEGGASGHLEP